DGGAGGGDGGAGGGDGGAGGGDGGAGGGEGPIEEPTTPAGGGDGTTPDSGNGASPQDQGSSALIDTGDDVSGTSAQGNGKELAETGAAETTFLLIGAATMIAGGIGFRVLPRLAAGRGAAA
ncbi:LPXTG cell wall anchor domain-containing protein, partial [Streptomyces pimonensis]